MPAHEDDATYTGAGVRKPPKEETAGRDTSDGAACAIEAGVARNFDRSREFSKNLGFEYVYNFGVMARVLLAGESRFLSSCDFKELRVIKRARFTTLTLAASQHSFCSIARGTQKNFDAFKLKLFRFAGQDNHRISDCADLT